MSVTAVAAGNRGDENHCPHGSEVLLCEAGKKHDDSVKGIVSHMEMGTGVK